MPNSRKLPEAQWRKSSYSRGTGGDCVEVADLTPHMAVRDSKNPTAPYVTFSATAWAGFLTHAAK
ncbi:DUF397 domain-containing protein [Streptomyces olivochromogenes]|uniref:DUF397 domain-containing protein n=1 Tax=Streptomyces olivochromogenes TaxID=1963 RepID=UPI001F16003E|nr:DUF397 domain-containing protein [Streptomyces olivochromogenes]MCF3134328.1 DUF397 domain-containing protein [Streptomyces olivochromogenes]